MSKKRGSYHFEYLLEQINELKRNIITIDKVYPIGSIYITRSNADPNTLFEGTKWEKYGVGRTLLGTDSTSDEIGGRNTVTLTIPNLPNHAHNYSPSGNIVSTFIGNKVMTEEEDTPHTHTFSGSTDISGKHQHYNNLFINEGGTVSHYAPTIGKMSDAMNTSFDGEHTHTFNGITNNQSNSHTHKITAEGTVSSTFVGNNSTTSSIGSGTSINIQNPYITVYMWKRIS